MREPFLCVFLWVSCAHSWGLERQSHGVVCWLRSCFEFVSVGMSYELTVLIFRAFYSFVVHFCGLVASSVGLIICVCAGFLLCCLFKLLKIKRWFFLSATKWAKSGGVCFLSWFSVFSATCIHLLRCSSANKPFHLIHLSRTSSESSNYVIVLLF